MRQSLYWRKWSFERTFFKFQIVYNNACAFCNRHGYLKTSANSQPESLQQGKCYSLIVHVATLVIWVFKIGSQVGTRNVDKLDTLMSYVLCGWCLYWQGLLQDTVAPRYPYMFKWLKHRIVHYMLNPCACDVIGVSLSEPHITWLHWWHFCMYVR